MKELEIEELTVEDGFEGDVCFRIDGYDNCGSAYVSRTNAFRIRDWLTQFLEYENSVPGGQKHQ